MITGIGIDQIEVSRIVEKISGGNRFLELVFSKDEIAYCDARKNRYEHFAARFAAKEAFLKATGMGLRAGYQLSGIEVLSDGESRPEIRLHGRFEELALERGWNRIHLTITHLSAVATAVVVIEA